MPPELRTPKRPEIIARAAATLCSVGLAVWGLLLLFYSFAPWYRWMPSLDPAAWPSWLGWFIDDLREDPWGVAYNLWLAGAAFGLFAYADDPRKGSAWVTLAQAGGGFCALGVVGLQLNMTFDFFRLVLPGR